jgi:hypothetical protein
MTVITPVRPKLDVLKRYLDAFNRADWETFRAILTADSIHIEPGVPEATTVACSVAGSRDHRGPALRVVRP